MFEAVLNWVKHNRKEREPYLPDMLEFVRMPLLTPRYITDVIDSEVNTHTHTHAHTLSLSDPLTHSLRQLRIVSGDIAVSVSMVINEGLTS